MRCKALIIPSCPAHVFAFVQLEYGGSTAAGISQLFVYLHSESNREAPRGYVRGCLPLAAARSALCGRCEHQQGPVGVG